MKPFHHDLRRTGSRLYAVPFASKPYELLAIVGAALCLVAHFLAQFNEKYGRTITACSPQAMDALMRYDYPGNVRQLEHAMEHAFVVTPAEADVVPPAALPPEILAGPLGGKPAPAAAEGKRPAVTGSVLIAHTVWRTFWRKLVGV